MHPMALLKLSGCSVCSGCGSVDRRRSESDLERVYCTRHVVPHDMVSTEGTFQPSPVCGAILRNENATVRWDEEIPRRHMSRLLVEWSYWYRPTLRRIVSGLILAELQGEKGTLARGLSSALNLRVSVACHLYREWLGDEYESAVKILDVNDKEHKSNDYRGSVSQQTRGYRVLERLASQLCDVWELGVRG